VRIRPLNLKTVWWGEEDMPQGLKPVVFEQG